MAVCFSLASRAATQNRCISPRVSAPVSSPRSSHSLLLLLLLRGTQDQRARQGVPPSAVGAAGWCSGHPEACSVSVPAAGGWVPSGRPRAPVRALSPAERALRPKDLTSPGGAAAQELGLICGILRKPPRDPCAGDGVQQNASLVWKAAPVPPPPVPPWTVVAIYSQCPEGLCRSEARLSPASGWLASVPAEVWRRLCLCPLPPPSPHPTGEAVRLDPGTPSRAPSLCTLSRAPSTRSVFLTFPTRPTCLPPRQ